MSNQDRSLAGNRPKYIRFDLVKEAHKADARIAVYDFNQDFSKSFYQYGKKEGIIVDLKCENLKTVLQSASKHHQFGVHITWLLISHDDRNSSEVNDIFYNVSILPNSNVYWMPNEREIFELYKIKLNHPIRYNLLYSSSNLASHMDRFWVNLPTAPARRKNLHGVDLKCATIISQPQYFLGWQDLTMKHIDTWPKFTYPLMMNLAQDLNYRNDMFQIDNYGVEFANGSFDGICGHLQRKEIEFGITSMFMRTDRWKAVDFCAETLELKSSFIFHQPPKSLVTNIFLLPFDTAVWVTSIFIYILVGLLTVLFWRLMKHHDVQLKLLTPPEVFSLVLGTICQQGTHLSPSLVSIRIVIFASLVASLFIFTSYSAKIVVLLQTPSQQIKTVSDLAHSPLSMGVQETTYKKVYFTESTDAATQFLYKHKIVPQGDSAYLSVVEGISKMRNQNMFAFQVEASSGYDIISKTYTEREKCGLAEIEAFKLPMVSIPIKKNSGYKELFASRLRWHREVGLIDRTKKIWIAQKPQCDEGLSGFVTVGIADCLPAFKVLLYGIPFSIIVLILEIITKYGSGRRKIKRLKMSDVN